ncbi:hypothetical protein L226DRAFT_480446 [Lentinus tigrinus ALCF2SS1-7]|uniref:Integral membrane protein n=1 Tax=Lentinus tigrinus ALCF2SS1-6 TaxID=1328759 RepID=A0A5C2RZV8_9APHY|nr:hypothetical protein L227DRAFT_553439 [Lentinus tigrinus ALCF2SS1-6]RPD79550.1 hypothetical protein L226DRAFT_480446 [Lentinus tigrinus ALCF2SS1-7]
MSRRAADPPQAHDPSPRTSELDSTAQFSRHRATIHRPRTVTRPLPFFHPTRASFALHHPSAKEEIEGRPHARWSSRASRKHRYSRRPICIAHPSAEKMEGAIPEGPLQEGFSLLEQRVRHTEDQVKVHLAWDLSFWIAVVFVLGSAAWIINGFFLFLPLLNIGTDSFTASAWSAFAGGTLFEVGSYLMYVEALNAGHEELFAPALWELVAHGSGTVSDPPSPDSQSDTAEKGLTGAERGRRTFKFRWIGIGSWRELGFLACFVQMLAATVFWVSTITGIPNVISGLPEDPPTAITDVFFWTPQVIGGTGFIISSLLLMIEVQKKWWLPNLRSMGWHIGFWNLVGAVGFTLCGALGYGSLASSGENYQSVLSTFWGSWAFMIGSVIQLWESLWRESPAQ